MKSTRKFSSSDNIIDLIEQDYNIIPVLSRFSIPLGIGNDTISDVCQKAGIDVHVFLLVVNYMLTGCIDNNELNRVSAADVAAFLHKSHEYFLGYKFVHIRNNLMSALDEGHSDINPAIINYYDDYIKQVKKHFAYEEKKVFPYVKALSTGADTSGYTIDIFRRHHDEEVEMRLTELKNIILRFYTTTRPDLMYDVLVDLYTCEADLELHTEIENNILIPLVSKLENKRTI